MAKIAANLGKEWIFLETLYRIYSISGYNIAHIDVTAKLCEEHNIRYQDVDRVEAVVNWLETQYPSPAFPTRREDIGEAKPGSTRYYSAYGVVKRGFPLLPTGADPPEVLDLMKRVTIIPSHDMPLFAPRITIFTKDGKSYTKQKATGARPFIGTSERRKCAAFARSSPACLYRVRRFEEIIATCLRPRTTGESRPPHSVDGERECFRSARTSRRRLTVEVHQRYIAPCSPRRTYGTFETLREPACPDPVFYLGHRLS